MHVYGCYGRNINYVAAAMYCVEAAVRIGLANPACTSNVNEWLPNQKTIEPKKIKDLDFCREDFCQRKKKRALVASPKKRFYSLKNCDLKPLSIKDFAESKSNIPALKYGRDMDIANTYIEFSRGNILTLN